jgi:multidrug efflux pump subunit AcrB
MGEVIDRGLARAKEELPRGYTASLGGQAEYMDEAFAEFGLVTVIAINVQLHANKSSRTSTFCALRA